MGNRMWMLWALGLSIAVFGCGDDDDRPPVVEDANVADAEMDSSVRSVPPVLKNLMFDIRGCTTGDCAGAGGEGGDIVYAAGYSHPLVFGFDFMIDGKPLSPTYEFYVKPDANVMAPVGGTIQNLNLSQNGEDYSFFIEVDGSSTYTVIIDHVQAPTVSNGDVVSAGDILGKAGLWTPEQGRTELQINADETDHAVCPFSLLDETLKDDYSQRLNAMYADFETVKGSADIYDETKHVLPGCLYESFYNP